MIQACLWSNEVGISQGVNYGMLARDHSAKLLPARNLSRNPRRWDPSTFVLCPPCSSTSQKWCFPDHSSCFASRSTVPGKACQDIKECLLVFIVLYLFVLIWASDEPALNKFARRQAKKRKQALVQASQICLLLYLSSVVDRAIHLLPHFTNIKTDAKEESLMCLRIGKIAESVIIRRQMVYWRCILQFSNTLLGSMLGSDIMCKDPTVQKML